MRNYRTERRPFSRRHPIFLRGIKLVARGGEFFCDDIAQIHEIVQAFFEGLDGGCVLCSVRRLVSYFSHSAGK